MTVMAIVLLALTLAVLTPGWWLSDSRRAHTGSAVAGAALLAVLGIALMFHVVDLYSGYNDVTHGFLLLLAPLVAVFGGGPVTAAVLHRVDLSDDASDIDGAEQVLRGGAWIGVMERAAIYTCLVMGWTEGVAVVLAVKGLGRYPELRRPGAAERFIIGTFASVLWAVACAIILIACG